MKAEVDKLGINTVTNAPTRWGNLKTKVSDFDVGKLKTVPVDLNKFSDVVANEIVNNTKLNMLKTKVNSLDKKIPNAATLIHINQYNTDKQNSEKKIPSVDKKIPNTSGLVTTTILNTKISEVEKKMPGTNILVATTVLNTKISEVENKNPDHAKYITTQEFNKLTAENFAARLK